MGLLGVGMVAWSVNCEFTTLAGCGDWRVEWGSEPRAAKALFGRRTHAYTAKSLASSASGI